MSGKSGIFVRFLEEADEIPEFAPPRDTDSSILSGNGGIRRPHHGTGRHLLHVAGSTHGDIWSQPVD